jgi:hypothetical protein
MKELQGFGTNSANISSTSSRTDSVVCAALSPPPPTRALIDASELLCAGFGNGNRLVSDERFFSENRQKQYTELQSDRCIQTPEQQLTSEKGLGHSIINNIALEVELCPYPHEIGLHRRSIAFIGFRQRSCSSTRLIGSSYQFFEQVLSP